MNKFNNLQPLPRGLGGGGAIPKHIITVFSIILKN